MKNDITITIKPSFYLYCALLMLLLPLRWVLAAMFSALIHECCHIVAIKLCRVELHSVTVGAFGAKLHTGCMTHTRELICALAGPMGSLVMLLFSKWLPVTAFCCMIQSGFNLLPLYPADGGRALRCILLLALPHDRAERIIHIFECILRAGIVSLCLYGVIVLKLNIAVFLAALVLCFGKTPCKAGKYKVQ